MNNRMRQVLYHLFISAVMMILVFPGCSEKGIAKKTGKEPMAIHGHRVKSEFLSDEITSFGSLMHTRKNDITAAVAGVIEEIPFREGDSVQNGSMLARLSNIQLTNSYEQAKAAHIGAKASTALAEAQYHDYQSQLEARFLTLRKTDQELTQRERQLNNLRTDVKNSEALHLVGGVSEDQLRTVRYSFLAAESEYEKLMLEKKILLIGLRDSDITNAGFSVPEQDAARQSLLIDLNSQTKYAEVQVARAQEEIANTQKNSAKALVRELKLVAPCDGIIGAVYKECGERVEAGEKILTVIDSKNIWAVFPVNEKDAARIHVGMQAISIIEAIGEKPIPGIVDSIAPTVDPQSGNVTIKVLLENPKNKARPGMFTRIHILTDNAKEKILIPQNCLVQREENQGIVITANNNRIFQRTVQLGEEYSEQIEICGGLRENEIVVIDPTPLLREGDKVVINEKK